MDFPTDSLRDILFFDIETAATSPSYVDLSEELQTLWQKKASYIHRTSHQRSLDLTPELISQYYDDKAGIYAEYAQVVCISMGIVSGRGDDRRIRIKSIFHEDEKEVLKGFSKLLREHYDDPYSSYLCGHNIREFDIPFLCRRYLANRIPMPTLLKVGGLRPWQVSYLIDTLDLWKFGDYKYYTSLELLCHVLDIPSPKDGLRGDEVSTAFYDGRLDDIRHYCERDVVATVRLYLRCLELSDIPDEQILYIDAEDE